jgi:hypothetical protein
VKRILQLSRSFALLMVVTAMMIVCGCGTDPKYHADAEVFGASIRNADWRLDGKPVRVKAGIQW